METLHQSLEILWSGCALGLAANDSPLAGSSADNPTPPLKLSNGLAVTTSHGFMGFVVVVEYRNLLF